MTNLRSGFAAALAAFALTLFAPGTFAQDSRIASNEPTVAQIYQAANSGNLDRADAMVNEVVKAHPNSAKAHYVKAEIAARQGKTDVAKQELAKAEQLAPGLPFVKAESAQALRNQLSNARANANANAATQPRTRQMGAPADAGAASPAPTRSFPWGTLAIVAGIVLVGMAVLRRRNAAMTTSGYAGASGNTSAAPYGQTGGAPLYPPNAGMQPGYPPPQPSMGSSIARGVGTGLAMGAGMVAAEEIGHRMFGHGDARAAGHDPNAVGNLNTPSLDQIDDGMRRNLNSDMGGADFGIDDGGGWDGGGGDIGGGGGDWDT